MNIIILVDKLNWSYHSIAKSILKYNSDKDVQIHYTHIKNNIKHIKSVYKQYDRILVMGWQNFKLVDFLPKKKTLVGIHGHHAWDEGMTQPGVDIEPSQNLIEFLNEFISVNVVSRKLYNIFKNAGVNRLFYTPNGVDSQMFFPRTKDSDNFVVGYSGSSAHDKRKGISKFIRPAAKKADVKLALAMLSTDKHVSLEKMPDFYNDLDAYVCASSSEGFSLSVLEAASCGLPIISTKVGGCEDLIKNGHNGFLVERDVDKITEKIQILRNDKNKRLEMGNNMRSTIERNYCWSVRAHDWVQFLKA